MQGNEYGLVVAWAQAFSGNGQSLSDFFHGCQAAGQTSRYSYAFLKRHGSAGWPRRTGAEQASAHICGDNAKSSAGPGIALAC